MSDKAAEPESRWHEIKKLSDASVKALEEAGPAWRSLDRGHQAVLLIEYTFHTQRRILTELRDLLFNTILQADDETVERARAGVVAARRAGKPPHEFFSQQLAAARSVH